MKNRLTKTSLSLVLFALACTTSAFAQMPPPGGRPGPGGPRHGAVPPAEALATIPGLSAGQQTELRQILIERRNSLESARQHWRSEFEALRVKQRNERDRIDDHATEQLRKALGDAGYKAYAEWRVRHHGPRHRGMVGRGDHHGPNKRGRGGPGAPGRGPMPPPDRGD